MSNWEVVKPEENTSQWEVVSKPPSNDKPYYPSQEPMGFGARAQDVANRLNEDRKKILPAVGNMITSALNEAPTEVPGAVKQMINPMDFGRVGKNALINTSNIEKSIINAPSSMMKYMAHLGIGAPKFAESVPRMEKEPVGEYIKSTMGKEQAGDKLLQHSVDMLSMMTPAGQAVGGAAKSGITKIADKTLAPVSNMMSGKPKYEALKAKLGISEKTQAAKQLEDVAQQKEAAHQASIEPAQTAEESLNNAKETLKKVQEQSKAKNLPSGVGSTEGKIASHEQNLADIKNNMKALNHQIDNLESIPEYKASEPHVDNTTEASANVKQAQEHLSAADIGHQAAEHMVGQADQAISHHLNPKADYEVRTQEALKHGIDESENYFKSSYANMMDDIKQNDFAMPSVNEGYNINVKQEKTKAMENYGKDPNGHFEHGLDLMPTANDRMASGFMSKQKDLRNYISGLFRQAANERMYGRHVSADELFKAAKALKPFEDIVDKTLRDGLGPYLPKYKQLMEGYRDQIYPLRENNVANNIVNGGKMSGDISGELAGNEPGQALLRQLANNNPEIQRNIIGQKYHKGKPELVHDPDERLREYTNNMPELNQLLNQREQALSSVQEAQQIKDKAAARHAEAQAAEKEAIAQNEAAKKAKESEEEKRLNEHEAKVATRENAENKFQGEIGKLHDQAKKLERELPGLKQNRIDLEKAAKETEAAAKMKNVTAKEHAKLKTEASKARTAANAAKKAEESAVGKLADTHFGIKSLTHLGIKAVKYIGKKLY